MNAKNSRKFTRIIHREYKDADGNIHTEYKDAQGNIYTEYQDSLGNFHSDQNESVNSKLADAHIQNVRVDREVNRQVAHSDRADQNTSKGLLIGVIVTTVAGLIAGVIYFLNDVNNPQPTPIVNIPTEKIAPQQNPTPTQVKVVEKEVVKIVPVEVPVPVPAQTKVPETNNSPSTVNNNITVKPSESNPAQKETNNKTSVAKTVQNPTTSSQKPVISTSSNNATSTETDVDLKNEILKKFQNGLPNNQLKVDVKNSDVIVSGNVETQEQIQQIPSLVKSIDGVKKLNITVTVANNVPN
ncbi:BON domain-containing protein [Geminocystis sp. NIES-3709]|uniref:BON domain-containing protein n=1 Tax=Geminocystis sp. NIES-3709 TaxID=1617448 RepID=UPI0005FCD959|nr:BON domain-containing protein [Geminocystis sp. NIES-3709]BAQ66343.1 hypothetical protein GM3709_3108 [Geminocystis sp. NIES-3709]